LYPLKFSRQPESPLDLIRLASFVIQFTGEAGGAERAATCGKHVRRLANYSCLTFAISAIPSRPHRSRDACLLIEADPAWLSISRCASLSQLSTFRITRRGRQVRPGDEHSPAKGDSLSFLSLSHVRPLSITQQSNATFDVPGRFRHRLHYSASFRFARDSAAFRNITERQWTGTGRSGG